ncbi:MAG: hypothetical protein DRJ15_16080, partial [Bacteroidetes bacterium]
TGSHTETEPEIDFATVQGKTITLTADRSYTITGLSNTNPAGLLEITHDDNTPSFSGVTELESMIDKSGVYYLRFTRNPSGTIIQTNQGGGAGVVQGLESDVIISSEILAINTTPQVIKTAPVAGILDTPISAWVYLNYKVAYATNTTLQLISGSTVIGTCDCLAETTSGWYPFVLSGTPEANAALSISALTGDPITGTGEVVVKVNYIVYDSTGFTFPSITYSINYDFLTSQAWAVGTMPDGWATLIGTQDGVNTLIDEVAGGMRFKSSDDFDIVNYGDGVGEVDIVVSTTYNYELIIDSVTSGGVILYGLDSNSGVLSTPGTHTGTIETGSWNFLKIRRSSPADLVIRSIKLWV